MYCTARRQQRTRRALPAPATIPSMDENRGKPFQFGLRNLFAITVWVATTAWFARLVWIPGDYLDNSVPIVAFALLAGIMFLLLVVDRA